MCVKTKHTYTNIYIKRIRVLSYYTFRCEELSSKSEEAAQKYAIPTYKNLEVCKDHVTWTNTIIIALIVGVVSCLCLVLLIVHGIRRFYKPARPRIKKTFVVRRQPATSFDTPLTNRPIATEQCEITIENCCNMNYCDTVSVNYCYTVILFYKPRYKTVFLRLF